MTDVWIPITNAGGVPVDLATWIDIKREKRRCLVRVVQESQSRFFALQDQMIESAKMDDSDVTRSYLSQLADERVVTETLRRRLDHLERQRQGRDRGSRN